MRDAHGIEAGGELAKAGSNGLSNAQASDMDEMQKKLDQLKHMWEVK